MLDRDQLWMPMLAMKQFHEGRQTYHRNAQQFLGFSLDGRYLRYLACISIVSWSSSVSLRTDICNLSFSTTHFLYPCQSPSSSWDRRMNLWQLSNDGHGMCELSLATSYYKLAMTICRKESRSFTELPVDLADAHCLKTAVPYQCDARATRVSGHTHSNKHQAVCYQWRF
jgi:hypothetical protein